MKTEGSVNVADHSGKPVKPEEQLGLYDGCQIDTLAESYAWIDLDHGRLAKMDPKSKLGFQRKDGKLQILIQSGIVFFNATPQCDPLGAFLLYRT